MLAYRHAFHAGNHADVLKHVVLLAVLEYLNTKPAGWRCIDTHAGAGGYSLEGAYAQKKAEFADGIGRLVGRDDLPEPVAALVRQVQAFNDGRGLRQYPGSPALARACQRGQDQLRLYELHPTEHKILHSYLGDEPGVQVHLGDGFGAIKGQLPHATRRAVLLIDPPYELKTDYARTLAAVREALQRMPETIVIVWLPQLQLLEAAQLPQRLKAAADAGAKKGWIHARLTVAPPQARGFGMLGSSVFVANPPHSLFSTLQPVLPWLAQVLAQVDDAKSALEKSASA
ncbi:MAG: 23S rRNA (adenine(2030)-N(6))-methyltransferase RlmJ [Ideonella sp. WA131b]|jgi:23S rRNA (adenine2030-N6)-methyltransferase|nr:23S rRNA (adenine(2030)-N(6))-methyltransferase RlmJ [Ideonella sp. WA131b]